jgi:hypothetical protein
MTYTITRQNATADALAIHEAIFRLVADGGQGSALAAKLREMRDQIEQAEPVVEEPTEFGSIVRATCATVTGLLWQKSPIHGKHYWESETGIEYFDHAAYTHGVETTVARGIRVLDAYRAGAITAEREDAYINAINVLQELL